MSGSDNLNPYQFSGGYNPYDSSGYGSNGGGSSTGEFSGDAMTGEALKNFTSSGVQGPVDPNVGGSGPNLNPFAGAPDGQGNVNGGGYGNDNPSNQGEPLTGSSPGSSGGSSSSPLSPSASPGFDQFNRYTGPTSI